MTLPHCLRNMVYEIWFTKFCLQEKFEISKYLNSAYIYKNQNFDITILGIHLAIRQCRINISVLSRIGLKTNIKTASIQ